MARSQSAAADTDPLMPTADGDTATSPSLLRFAAPAHVSAITLSTEREIHVEDGVLAVPDDLSDDERRQITRAGFTAV
ncbi:hypothetical protein [Sphingomonas asaccharolytica]|uniref:hypothetical protein n=1 Tax=Sphingomonas asaccharolytica TaxID=40681 RepID=UPI00082F0A47|nr:hypothetical protein [Sphingomonas asaccharolytica]